MPVTAPTAVLLAGLAGKVFVGEAYPTGNAYLQAFAVDGVDVQKEPPLERWPQAVTLHCMSAQACAEKEVGRAARAGKRQGYLDQKLGGLIPDRVKKFRSADSDYFDCVDQDACNTNVSVVRYEIAKPPNNVAYQVLAVAADLPIERLEYISGDAKRPASKVAVSGDLKSSKEPDPKDCTTEPQSLADAKVILTAKFKDRKESLRLSKYVNPGCYGHLAQIYVLDVLDGSKVTGTYVAERWMGSI
ncbi:MAG: hypothetical protein FJ146_15830 [Deltaproteobacteria bacterium]|nr:hypothetical protein [Deltaproteobacteria bacterium]